jgi:hypothetical protein
VRVSARSRERHVEDSDDATILPFSGHRGLDQDAAGEGETDRTDPLKEGGVTALTSLCLTPSPPSPLPRQILGKVAKAEKKEDKAAANKKIEAHRLDTAKVPIHRLRRESVKVTVCAHGWQVFFDLFTYAPLVGYDKMVAGVALGDGVAGLAGGFSSLLSLQKIWKGLK